MITDAEIEAYRQCPHYSCFITVDENPLYLCSHATGVTIEASEASMVSAGEIAGQCHHLVYTGDPWDDVVIFGESTHMVLTGVRECQQG